MISKNDKPKIVTDIELVKVNPLFRKEQILYLIGSRERDCVLCTKSNEVAQQVMAVSKYFDGVSSIEEINEMLGGNSLESLCKIISRLDKTGLLESSKNTINSELKLVAKNILSISLQKPNQMVRNICQGLLFLYPILIGLLILVISSLFFSLSANPFNVIYTISELFIASIIIHIFTILHELGHLLVAWVYGIEIESINISLRWYVIPIVYVKYNGINFLQPQIKAKVLLGGLLMNLLCALILFFVWLITNQNILLLLSIYNFGMMLASLYPQTLSDGYFLLLLLANRPSMRLDAVKWLFSSPKTKPSRLTILFVSIYIFVTIGGLYSAYLVFGNTITNICYYFDINTNVIAAICFILYMFLIIKMIKKGKRYFG